MKIRNKLYPDGNDHRKPDKIATTAERLQEIMLIRQMKQADLARSTGISRGSISNYVLGRYEPKSDIIQMLANALNCSEMWLWGYDVPLEKQEKETSPSQPTLTEGEKVLLDLFRRVPEDQQQLVLQMIQVALGNRG